MKKSNIFKNLVLVVLPFVVITSCNSDDNSNPTPSEPTIPTNGLVAWYPFNANANDLSGNNLNANVVGTTLTTDRNNGANKSYDFDVANATFGNQNDEIFVPYSS